MRNQLRKCIFLILAFILSRNTYACTVAPSFTYSTTHTCGVPYIVKAVNSSTGSYKNSAKYWWKINKVKASDTTVGLDSIKFLLKLVGNNTIKLFVKDSTGCIDSSAASTISVSTNAKSIKDQNAIYSFSPTFMNCLQFITDPDTFSIRFESADTLKSLKVFWGDGTSDLSLGNYPPNTSVSHLYNALGIYTVKIVTTNNGCIDTVYGTVYNQRQPTAGIVGPPSGSNRGCVPHTLKIVNNSYNISNNTTFLIDWGNGDAQSLPYTGYKDTVYHTYKTGICAGVIKITASNVCGSSFTTWNPIDISDRDKAKWAVTMTCDPLQNHIFYNQSTDNYCLIPDIKEYYWDFGDGTTFGWTTSKSDQYHKYKKEGDYIVTLIAKSGCGNDTFKSQVRVYYNPVAGFKFTANRGCKPLAVTLTDTSIGRGYTRLWTVVDGSTTKTFNDSVLNYTFTSAGNNTVTLKVTNPCSTSVLTRTFVVNDKPKAQFANIPGTCIPMQVTFTNTSTSYFVNPTYAWDFGDGTTSALKSPASKTYATAGNYTVRLIVSDSCGTDTFSQTFTAYGLPVAVLSGDTSGCTFDSLSFNNLSTNSTTYNWDFGDGQTLNTSVAGITKHAYSLTGSFTIRLISGTGSGCKDTAYHSLNIKPGAKAQFNLNRIYGCSPATFKVTNTSIYGKDYSWYANGRLISTATNPNDTTLLTDSTVVSLVLIATSNSSCLGDTAQNTYFTPKNPKAIIANHDSGCGLLKVQFNNQSTYTVSSFWNLGNGTTSTAANPVANYASAGSNDTFYFAHLKVSNWAGCTDSTSAGIKVFPGPKADFSMNRDKGCGPLSVSFTNTSKTNNKDPFSSLSHSWKFGDGSSSTATDPNHSFNPGITKDTFYSVSLKTTTINGCYDSITKIVQVYPIPLVRFAPDKTSGCAVLAVNFANSSSPKDTGSINIMTFSWSSGNGITSTAKNFSASYKASSYRDTVYKVRLIGTSEHGCKDSSFSNITVHPQPDARFALNNNAGCTPLHLSTINISVSKDGGPLTHDWDFGNGYKSAAKDDSSIYINNSNNDVAFTIRYQAISQYGCRDTASQVITVHPKPVAKFNVSTKKACAPVALTVTDNSINASKYFWGEGGNYTTGGLNKTFLLPGLKLFDTTYVIAHAVTSVNGCNSDTVYQQILAQGTPEASFSYVKDSLCARENVGLVNNSLGAYRFNWNFGDNTTSTLINPKHRFITNAGNGRDSVFNVTLEVISASGCRDTVTHPVYLVNRLVYKIVMDNPVGCTDLTVTMAQTAPDFKTLRWDFGDNTSFGYGDTVTHTFVNPLGNMAIQPKVSLFRQKFNCLDTSYAAVRVYPKPTADFKTQRNDPCDAGIYQMINKSKNNTNNLWTVDSVMYTVSSFSIMLPGSVHGDTFYNVKLVVTNNYQCADTLEQRVKVKPKLQIKFDQLGNLACEDGIVSFTNKSRNAVRFFWRFGDGGLSNEVNPSYSYTHYGNYKIMLYGYDIDGCVDSSDGSAFYKVLERPKADFAFAPLLPKLPNALVNFTAKPTIITVNEDDLRYEWDFGDSTYPTGNKNDKDPSHTYTKSGTRMVKLTIWNQLCSDEISKPIYIEDPKPSPDFTGDTIYGCAPFRVHFRNRTTNAQSYRWIFGDGSPDSYEENPTHVYQFAGTWEVTLIATGTGGTNTITRKAYITTYPKPFLDFYTNKRFLNLPNAVFTMLNNSNTVNNNWDLYDTLGKIIESSTLRDPSFYINQGGRFTVRLIGTNSYGCVDTLIKEDYLATETQGFVYVPSAFSPNKNERNDGFKPSLYNIKERNYVFRVFNRWGEMLFETNDVNAEWDGNFNGKMCEQDVYIWTVNGEYENDDLFSFRGTVTLLR